MADLTELAGINQLFRVGNRRDAAVIEHHQISDLRFADGCNHLFGISYVQSQRFLAHDMFAGARCGQSDLRV